MSHGRMAWSIFYIVKSKLLSMSNWQAAKKDVMLL